MNGQSGPGDRMRGPGARRGAGAGGGHPAAMLLRARQQLELTDDQVKRLEALQNAPLPKSSPADLMRAQADLLEATQGDGNLGNARAALDKLSRLRNEQMLSRIKLQQDARAVLTSSQKSKVDNLRQQMRGRMGANRARGMRQGGMRKGGMRQGAMRDGMRQEMRQRMRQDGQNNLRPRAPQGPFGPQGPQGPMPRMRRGGEPMDMNGPMQPTIPPVPPAN